jgi:hypothetical protein
MQVLQYNELDPSRAADAFRRVVGHLRVGDFRAADARKLPPTPFYRAKLNDSDRLLFRFARFGGQTYLVLLEIIWNHAYDRSRFLNGAPVDEGKLELLPAAAAAESDAAELTFVSDARPHVHVLDRILSFDDAQREAYLLAPPLILIGSAGSGKTVLSLEKLKQLSGDILYVTHSAFLAENARNLYYSFNYDNEAQDIEFLSYKEYLETLRVPKGRPLAYREFERWFARHAVSSRIRGAHKVFEEFSGVLTGADIQNPYLAREDYAELGVRRSIFSSEERPAVYDLFLKYLDFLRQEGLYDLNIAAHDALPLCKPAYDYVVVDEVQDLTNVQLYSILKSLRSPDRFVLCGDANQIVHPNFFSWAGVKSMFHEQRAQGRAEIVRVLNANYRNSLQVTELANRLLRIKSARFGSIDRESNYLVRSVGGRPGAVELLRSDPKTQGDLNAKTRRSTRFAVVCLRAEDKVEVRRYFETPLVFSIQEAKGLEYENVVLSNFVSGNAREYEAIVEGVTAEDLAGDLVYARARDKTDRSLEVYRFYVNALYVAMTRAVRNLYVVEANPDHPLLRLLGMGMPGQGVPLAEQRSSSEEWKEEARRLDLQGKKEQAEEIRRTILAQQPVPWKVMTPAGLPELEREALNPERFNKQAKQLLYEYAVFFGGQRLFEQLAALNFTRARDPKPDIPNVRRKYTQDILERTPEQLRRKMALHGVDFRDPLNHTPLMLAALVGRMDLIEELVRGGANPRLRDNWGRTPLQIALREAFASPEYAAAKIGTVYNSLAPASLNVKVEDRLVKLDRRRMEYFLLNSMMALLQDILRVKIAYRMPGFETRDFTHSLDGFPELVVPERRRRREYISSILSKNEVFRSDPYNRKLFLRIHHGFYLPNPNMEIEVEEDRWINVYDLIHIGGLEREAHDRNLKALVGYIRRFQQDRTSGRRLPAEGEERSAAPRSVGPPANAAQDSASGGRAPDPDSADVF